jgi:uncharacterized protein (TIGR02231 family)
MERVSGKSKICAVTVYLDRALVTRRVPLNLKAGVAEVIISPLPAALDRGTLRARGEGAVAVKILSVECENIYLGEAGDKKTKALEKELEKMRDELRQLNDRKGLLQSGVTNLAELTKSTILQLSRSLGRGMVSTEESQGLLNYLNEQQNKLMQDIFDLDLKVREQERLIAVKEDEYKRFTYNRMTEYAQAKVTLEASGAGQFTLLLDYAICGCSWKPTYDLRFDPQGEKLEMAYYGIISQNTGEGWEDVELRLSTHKPHIGATPAELSPWFLDFYYPPSPPASYAKREAQAPGAGAADEEMALEKSDKMRAVAPAEQAKPMVEAEIPVAQVESTGAAVVFLLPRRATVPPDGREQREPIGVYPLSGKVDYYIQPGMAELAYLRAKVANDSQVFILAGRTNVFRGDDYIGAGSLEQVAPGEEFESYLGVDERIKVERRESRRDKDEAGLIAKSNRLVREVNIELENTTDKEVKVEVVERLPISRNADIKVKMTKVEPKETETTKDNYLRWEQSIKAKGKLELKVGYEVEYPAERTISGI